MKSTHSEMALFATSIGEDLLSSKTNRFLRCHRPHAITTRFSKLSQHVINQVCRMSNGTLESTWLKLNAGKYCQASATSGHLNKVWTKSSCWLLQNRHSELSNTRFLSRFHLVSKLLRPRCHANTLILFGTFIFHTLRHTFPSNIDLEHSPVMVLASCFLSNLYPLRTLYCPFFSCS